jgi:S1-C subfamily serine protease
MDKQFKITLITVVIISIIISSVFGGALGFWAASTVSQGGVWESLFQPVDQGQNTRPGNQVVRVEEDSAVVEAVEKVSPAVVSIIITKDLPVLERYYSEPFGSDFFRQFFGSDFEEFFGTPQYRERGTQEQEIGGGTGFIVSSDGYIVTNRHVVSDTEAEYTVLMNDETRHKAEVMARDPMTDLAILKIDGQDLPAAELGDSSALKVGQKAIAIGNALGEFRNTVTTGVVSGLSRSIVAGSAQVESEKLMGVIQTDAAINQGNSGGPLLNIAGQVIGINTAMAQGAENIGFAIPINEVKDTINDVQEHGRIIRPWLGVRYVMLNEAIIQENNLEVDHGALITRGQSPAQLAVIPGSPADKAGLVENDIILEVDGTELNQDNSLAEVVADREPGEELELEVWHKGETKTVTIQLGEMPQNN